MNTEVIIDVTGPVIRNGRLYFSASDVSFFPGDALGDRSGDGHKGERLQFTAGAHTHHTDVRVSSSRRLSPRASFAGYLKSIRARAGDRLRVKRVGERHYRVEPVV